MGRPSLKWVPENFRGSEVTGVMLTLSPTEYLLVYVDFGASIKHSMHLEAWEEYFALAVLNIGRQACKWAQFNLK